MAINTRSKRPILLFIQRTLLPNHRSSPAILHFFYSFPTRFTQQSTMKITAPILALAALALIQAAPSADAKQIQPMERRGSGALSESFAAAAVSKRHDGPATSFAYLKKRDDDVNTEGGHDGDDDGDDYDEDDGDDGDDDGDDGGEYEEANPLM